MKDEDNKCYKCNKVFASSTNLTRHLNRKNPCDLRYKCDTCHKEFKQPSLYKRHINRKTSCAVKKPPVNESVQQRTCIACSKVYSTKRNMKEHYKRCKNRQIIDNDNDKNNLIQQMADQLNMYKTMFEQIMNKDSVRIDNIVNDNRTLNDNRVLNMTVYVNKLGDEDTSYITTEEVLQSLYNHDAKGFIAEMLTRIHGDTDHPSNHNVYIPNIKDDRVKYFDDGWKMSTYSLTCDRIVKKVYKIFNSSQSELIDNPKEWVYKKKEIDKTIKEIVAEYAEDKHGKINKKIILKTLHGLNNLIDFNQTHLPIDDVNDVKSDYI